MSAAVEQKPVIAPEAPVVEPTLAPVEPVAPVAPTTAEEKILEKPLEAAANPTTEETPKVDGETAVAAPVEEKKEEKPVEPIYSGALGYKAPGLKK
jgi:hypothetical protein